MLSKEEVDVAALDLPLASVEHHCASLNTWGCCSFTDQNQITGWVEERASSVLPKRDKTFGTDASSKVTIPSWASAEGTWLGYVLCLCSVNRAVRGQGYASRGQAGACSHPDTVNLLHLVVFSLEI